MTQRTGPGRFVPIRNPHGILWQTEAGVIGFDPVPDADPAPILEAITAGDTFDQIAEDHKGRRPTASSDLAQWKPARKAST